MVGGLWRNHSAVTVKLALVSLNHFRHTTHEGGGAPAVIVTDEPSPSRGSYGSGTATQVWSNTALHQVSPFLTQAIGS